MTQPTTFSLIPFATNSFFERLEMGDSESQAMSNVTAFYDLSLDQACEVIASINTTRTARRLLASIDSPMGAFAKLAQRNKNS